MRMRYAWAGAGLLVITVGCAPMPTVALQATPADLEILAGEWTGKYDSAALGRHGTLEFKLKAGTDEAYGDVVMTPQGRQTPYRPSPNGDVQASSTMHSSEVLTIKFIRASNGSLSGMLDRYWDPDRNCFAITTFNGNAAVGVVEGTFKTTFECGAGAATGTWTATRKRAKPSAAGR